VRVEIAGRLDAGVTAKDVMLALLAHPYVKGGGAIGKVLEYAGACVEGLIDERAALRTCRPRQSARESSRPTDDGSLLSERRGLVDEARALGWPASGPASYEPSSTSTRRRSLPWRCRIQETARSAIRGRCR
jgi:hypothetical protein